MITRSIAVPETNAPSKSVADASKPIAIPPMTVSGIMYLSSILSITLMSCLNPATCSPELAIFWACDFASIPAVFTQNTANNVEKNTKNTIWVTAWNKYLGSRPPLMIKSRIFVEPTQNASPETGCPWTKFPRNPKYEANFATPSQTPSPETQGAAAFCIIPPNNWILATSAAVRITGITEA